MGVPSQTSVAM